MASATASGTGQTLQRAPSDEELIDAVQRGDHQVASVIYERLVGVVDHTLYRVFGRREVDHDDLVQAAFEQIVVTLSRRSYARACSLRTWASSIASHVGFNALPSQAIRPPRIAEAPVAFECTIYETIVTESRHIFLGRVLWLHVRDGLVDTEKWRVHLQDYFPVGRFGASFYTRTRDRFAIEAPGHDKTEGRSTPIDEI